VRNDTILETVAEYGTPCYIYDEQLIERNIERFTNLTYPNRAVHFASMANNNPQLLNMLRKRGLGIFVNSVKHLKLAMDCGFSPAEIIYTSTGISRRDLEFIAKLGVTINLDSLGQLELFGQVAPGSRCGIRLNIDENSLGNIFIGAESRIGLLETELEQARAIAEKYDLSIVGTHVYLGTNIVSLPTMLEGVQRTLELSNIFPDLTYVDLGGGFPVSGDDIPEFDYAEYDKQIREMFVKYSAMRGRQIKLVLEPGRALFGDTAVFCTSVLDVKERPDRYLACVDASATLMPKSLFYGEFHGVEVIGKQDQPTEGKPTDVVGSTTYSRDFLAKGDLLPATQVDDVLAFHNAGSYGYSMITQFLGQDSPCEVLVAKDGSTRLLRARNEAGR
jgi:diaminopimelate decarboxylase